MSIGDSVFQLSLEAWTNDALLAVFFLIVGIEIKREVPFGGLSSPRKGALSLTGSLGGMIVPVALYLMLTSGGSATAGWGVPMATDIAFTLGIMALLGSRVPLPFKVFVSALARQMILARYWSLPHFKGTVSTSCRSSRQSQCLP